MTSQPRQRKTARQRAEEALGVAERKYERLHNDVDQAETSLRGLKNQLREAHARLEYARKDPALDQGTSTTSSTTNQQGADA